MSVDNAIMEAHERYKNEVIPEEVQRKGFLPTQEISLAEYCPGRRPLDIQEIIKEVVEKDEYVRSYHEGRTKPVKIPKLVYPKANRDHPAWHVAFLRLFAV